VKTYQLAQVHTIEVISGQDEHVLRFSTADALDVAAHRVRCSLAPARAIQRLFGCQYLDRSPGQSAEPVGMVDMAMQRGWAELGEDKDAPNTRMDAVAERDVNQAKLATDGHRWFALRFGQRV
jgi:hypothetical protein